MTKEYKCEVCGKISKEDQHYFLYNGFGSHVEGRTSGNTRELDQICKGCHEYINENIDNSINCIHRIRDMMKKAAKILFQESEDE